MDAKSFWCYIEDHYSLEVSPSFVTFEYLNLDKCGDTTDLFLQAGDYLENLKLSDEELENYKTQMFKKEDVTVTDYFENQLITKKDEKDRRKQIISTTLADIQKYGSFLKEAISDRMFHVQADSACIKEAEERILTLNK